MRVKFAEEPFAMIAYNALMESGGQVAIAHTTLEAFKALDVEFEYQILDQGVTLSLAAPPLPENVIDFTAWKQQRKDAASG